MKNIVKPIIILIVLLIIVILGIYFFYVNRTKISEDSFAVINDPTPKSVNLIMWDDPAGFKFQYPQDIVTNTNEDDPDHYAHLKLTHRDNLGSIVIWVSDPPIGKSGKEARTTEEWISFEKSLTDTSILDTVLNEKKAKKIVLENPKRIITGLIFEDILFHVDLNSPEDEYWRRVYQEILDSFILVPYEELAESYQEDAQIGSLQVHEYIDEEEVLE